MTGTSLAPQQGLEALIPAHLMRQADDYKTRYLFLPVYGYISSRQLATDQVLPAGQILKIMPPAKWYRPDELEAAGIKRDQIQGSIKLGDHGERELWHYSEPVKPVLNLILAGTSDQGGTEVVALAGYDLPAELLQRVNGWLFSRGTETATKLRASLERAGEAEFFAKQGFPAETKQIFGEVLTLCRQAFERAEAGLRREYEQFFRAYEASRIPNSGVEFHDSARYQHVLSWLNEVPVTEYAQRQATAGLNSVLSEVADLKREQAQTTNALAGALTTLGEGQKEMAKAITTLRAPVADEKPDASKNGKPNR